MKKLSRKKCFFVMVVCGMLSAICFGCRSTPPPPPPGPITADEIRGFANHLAPVVLALPEIAESSSVVRIELQDFSNKTRLLLDKNLFSKSLSMYLNRNSAGKVRFVCTDEITRMKRQNVIKQKDEEIVHEELKKLGAAIAQLDWVQKRTSPLKIAVIPVVNTNVVGMNANSMTAMLRSEIVNAAQGKIQFLMPGVVQDADFYLSGEFISDSLKHEGRVDLIQYIKEQEERIKKGEGFSLIQYDAFRGGNTKKTNILSSTTHIADEDLTKVPNVAKHLNIMLVDPKSKVCVYERMIKLERKVSTSSSKVSYILKGYLGNLATRRRGVQYDYFQFSIQLIDVESNDIILEDAYEIERSSTEDSVYQ